MTTDQLITYLPFLAPLFIAEVVLLVTALVHVLKHKNYKFGNRIVWIVIVVAFQIIGPVLYFVLGKGEE